MVDRGGLENRYTFGYPGFESLSLRKRIKSLKTSAEAEVFLCRKVAGSLLTMPPFCIKNSAPKERAGFSLVCKGPCGEQKGMGKRSAANPPRKRGQKSDFAYGNVWHLPFVQGPCGCQRALRV